MSKFNKRVQESAKAESCWTHEKPFENFILCVPWTDELDLLDEMTKGLHGEHARSVAFINGAVAFSRWEGFPIAWGTEVFGIVAIKNASSDTLARALRAQLQSSAFQPCTRIDVSGGDPFIKVLSKTEQDLTLIAAVNRQSLEP